MKRVVSAGLVLAVATASFAEEPAPPPVEPPAEPPVEPPLPVEAPPREEQPTVIPQRSREIKIEVPGERSRDNMLLVGGLAAGGLLVSALGVYWHLDSRDAADQINADDVTGHAWGQAQVDLEDRANRSRTRAIISYSIGGALLVGTLVTYIVTSPRSETTVIRTGFAPVEHGGVVTRMWSF